MARRTPRIRRFDLQRLMGSTKQGMSGRDNFGAGKAAVSSASHWRGRSISLRLAFDPLKANTQDRGRWILARCARRKH